jgi:hypothetical protein
MNDYKKGYYANNGTIPKQQKQNGVPPMSIAGIFLLLFI